MDEARERERGMVVNSDMERKLEIVTDREIRGRARDKKTNLNINKDMKIIISFPS